MRGGAMRGPRYNRIRITPACSSNVRALAWIRWAIAAACVKAAFACLWVAHAVADETKIETWSDDGGIE